MSLLTVLSGMEFRLLGQISAVAFSEPSTMNLTALIYGIEEAWSPNVVGFSAVDFECAIDGILRRTGYSADTDSKAGLAIIFWMVSFM